MVSLIKRNAKTLQHEEVPTIGKSGPVWKYDTWFVKEKSRVSEGMSEVLSVEWEPLATPTKILFVFVGFSIPNDGLSKFSGIAPSGAYTFTRMR